MYGISMSSFRYIYAYFPGLKCGQAWTNVSRFSHRTFGFIFSFLIEFYHVQFKHLVFTVLLYFITPDRVFIKSWKSKLCPCLVWLRLPQRSNITQSVGYYTTYEVACLAGGIVISNGFSQETRKTCGEWGGDAFKFPRAFGSRFLRQRLENDDFAAKNHTRAKTIPPAKQTT